MTVTSLPAAAKNSHREFSLTQRQERWMYDTDRGIEELIKRRGEEEVTLEWVADRLGRFVDLYPQFEVAVERLATWLARDDDDPE